MRICGVLDDGPPAGKLRSPMVSTGIADLQRSPRCFKLTSGSAPITRPLPDGDDHAHIPKERPGGNFLLGVGGATTIRRGIVTDTVFDNAILPFGAACRGNGHEDFPANARAGSILCGFRPLSDRRSGGNRFSKIEDFTIDVCVSARSWKGSKMSSSSATSARARRVT